MKHFFLPLLGALLTVCCVLLAFLLPPMLARADQEYLPQGASMNAARPCNLDDITTQTVAVSSNSAATTNATGSGVVRVVCTQAAHVVVATGPTGTTGSALIPQNSPEYFLTRGKKFAFIRSTADGICYVSECK